MFSQPYLKMNEDRFFAAFQGHSLIGNKFYDCIKILLYIGFIAEYIL